MAWTSPRTWVSGELVTAALMNTYIKDNQVALDTFLGGQNLTDNAVLMGNGTSPITPASGVYGYDSTAALKIEGADPYFSLKETTNNKEWKLQLIDSGSDAILQIPTPTSGGTTSYILQMFQGGAFYHRASNPDNAIFYNGDGTTERLRLGTSGVSFDGGSNYLGQYDEGTFTPYYKESTTATGQVAGSGKYLKIGDMITIHLEFSNVTSGASGGTSYGVIGGIPSIETAGSVGAPATTNLPCSNAFVVLYATGTIGYFYSMANNAAWGAELFRNSQSGIYLQMNSTYKIA